MNYKAIDFKTIIFNQLENTTKDFAKTLQLNNKDKDLTIVYVRNAKKKDPLIRITIRLDNGKKEVFELKIAVASPRYIGIVVKCGEDTAILKFQIFSKKLKNILLSYKNKDSFYKKYML